MPLPPTHDPPRHPNRALLLAVVSFVALSTSFGHDAHALTPCRSQDDCPQGRYCQAGMCQTAPAVGDGRALFGLGVPTIVAPRGGPDAALAVEATRRLRQTLSMLGVFRVIEKRSRVHAPLLEAPTPTGYDAQGWHESGAYALLFGALWSTSGGGVVLETRLFEVEQARSVPFAVSRQRIALDPDQKGLSDAVDRIAGGLAKHYTGRAGVLGTRIAFTRKLPGGAKEVFTVDLSGEDEQPITQNGSINMLPSWAPDGRLAFTSYRDGNPDLWLDRQKLSGRPDLNMGAAFSPDGRTVAVTLAKDGNAEVYLLDARSGAIIRRLTKNPAIDTSPTWSPDGKHIAFVSDRIGAPQIYVMTAKGRNLRQLTHEGYNTNPCWSPNGDAIVYDRLITAERSDLFRIDPKTGEIRRLTSGRWSSEDPSFSPDGRQIVFSSTKDGKAQLYVMSADGGPARRLTRGEGPYGAPAWSPIPIW